MPMLTYRCPEDHAFEHFFHRASDAPESYPCESPDCLCLALLSASPSDTMRRPYTYDFALEFQPRIVDRRADPDQPGRFIYSYPGSSSDPIDHGYERITLSTPDSLSRFCRDRGAEEKEIKQSQLYREKLMWEATTKEKREQIRQNLQKRFGRDSSAIWEATKRHIDSKREKKYDQMMRADINFHNQAQEFNQSNRQDHRDVSTGWKSRR